jgi:glycosyltransferase involved in cell wall biosynthesis
MKLLFILEHLPVFDSGMDVRLQQVLSLLRKRHHKITLFCRNLDKDIVLEYSEKLGAEIAGPDCDSIFLHKRTPASTGRITDVLEGKAYHGIIIFNWYWHAISLAEAYLELIRKHLPQTPLTVLTDDVHWLREEQHAQSKDCPIRHERALNIKTREQWVYTHVDHILAITELDQQNIKALQPACKVKLLRHGGYTSSKSSKNSFSNREGLVFVGTGENAANTEAISWFCQTVLPLVRVAIPSVPFYIVGQEPASGWPTAEQPYVHVLGYVENLEPILESNKIFVSPILFGTGIQTKNLLAMAHGLPLITTPCGAEGLHLNHNQQAFVTENPGEFAEHIIALYSQESKWTEMASHSLAFNSTTFPMAHLEEDLDDFIDDIDHIVPATIEFNNFSPAREIEKVFHINFWGKGPRKFTNRCSAHFAYASQLFSMGDYEAALSELRNIIALDFELGRHEDVLKLLSQAYELGQQLQCAEAIKSHAATLKENNDYWDTK